MSGITDFYLSWLGGNTFGNTPSPTTSVVVPPPLVVPDPIARYDFNNYIAGESTIINDVSGGDPATINLPLLNTFDATDASNNFLQIYAPNNFPDDTGGILLPSLTNVASIELWVQYPLPAEYYGQYFVDARTGATNGYWITSTTDAIGDFWNGGIIFFNTSGNIIDVSAGTPSIYNTIGNNGWFQVVINAPTAFTDDIALFMRYTGNQGMPIMIADIAVYDSVLTQEMIDQIYNDKCSRYGLAPI